MDRPVDGDQPQHLYNREIPGTTGGRNTTNSTAGTDQSPPLRAPAAIPPRCSDSHRHQQNADSAKRTQSRPAWPQVIKTNPISRLTISSSSLAASEPDTHLQLSTFLPAALACALQRPVQSPEFLDSKQVLRRHSSQGRGVGKRPRPAECGVPSKGARMRCSRARSSALEL
jgi:hypothetical protein